MAAVLVGTVCGQRLRCCPFEVVGRRFFVELDALELEVGANVRPIEREALAEPAQSIARVGQLARILVGD